MNRLIIVTGQTATGKTSLASKLATKYNGQLINCDSRQIYNHLDIITGKDLVHKHWLYDIIDPKEYFSSFDYAKLAVPIIKKLLSAGKTPIIVGGTYLYLKHLLYGVETENIPPNWKLRKKLANKSVLELQKIYEALMFQSINRLKQLNNSERNNPQRLIRKIEINNFRAKQQSITPERWNYALEESNRIILQKKLGRKNLAIEFIGLKYKTKEDLRKVIELRVEERLKRGALDEVKGLLKIGYKESDPGLKTIGYQQLLAHLRGALTKEEAVQQWITKEIQYAKRQYTFMKKDKNIKWREI